MQGSRPNPYRMLTLSLATDKSPYARGRSVDRFPALLETDKGATCKSSRCNPYRHGFKPTRPRLATHACIRYNVHLYNPLPYARNSENHDLQPTRPRLSTRHGCSSGFLQLGHHGRFILASRENHRPRCPGQPRANLRRRNASAIQTPIQTIPSSLDSSGWLWASRGLCAPKPIAPRSEDPEKQKARTRRASRFTHVPFLNRSARLPPSPELRARGPVPPAT